MDDETTALPTTDDRAGASAADVELERDVFLRSLLRELAGTLEETVGLDEAAGYVSVVVHLEPDTETGAATGREYFGPR